VNDSREGVHENGVSESNERCQGVGVSDSGEESNKVDVRDLGNGGDGAGGGILGLRCQYLLVHIALFAHIISSLANYLFVENLSPHLTYLVCVCVTHKAQHGIRE
jgi:hypothetical protein